MLSPLPQPLCWGWLQTRPGLLHLKAVVRVWVKPFSVRTPGSQGGTEETLTSSGSCCRQARDVVRTGGRQRAGIAGRAVVHAGARPPQGKAPNSGICFPFRSDRAETDFIEPLSDS